MVSTIEAPHSFSDSAHYFSALCRPASDKMHPYTDKMCLTMALVLSKKADHWARVSLASLGPA
jgi:hypothetical protein